VYRIFDAVRHTSLLVGLIGTTQVFYFWLLDPNCKKFSFILAQTHKKVETEGTATPCKNLTNTG
jgi:hypothetical protein